MITDLLFTIIILTFLIFGLKYPYISLSGIIWIDTIKPQQLSFSFLAEKPLSFLATGIFFLSVFLNIRAIKFPKVKMPLIMLILMMIWITVTTLKAQYPDLAMFKYEVAIKTMIFVTWMPFILDSRKKIECLIWIFIVSVGFFIFIEGCKTILGGGGYSISIVQSSAVNSGITETSTFSALTVAIAPFICYLYLYSSAARNNKYLRFYLLVLGITSLFAVIGTYARTGLVAAAVLAVLMFFISRHKWSLLIIGVVSGLIIIPMLQSDWVARMSTITNANEENSALVRLLVWRWTIDYASKHPVFGGGFFSYNDNRLMLQQYARDDEVVEVNEKGRAFHSIIFELLGEHGYVGLLIYLSLIGFSLKALLPFLGKKYQEISWLHYLSKMIMISVIVYIVGGLFVSIAFEPWLFYILFFGSSLQNLSIAESRNN